jgi:hypothetical protein
LSHDALALLAKLLTGTRTGSVKGLLMAELLGSFNAHVREALDALGCAGFGASYSLEDGFTLVNGSQDGPVRPSAPMRMASGQQRFAIGLATRLALYLLTPTARLGVLAIDEGLDCMDAEHLPLALESLRELAQSRVVPLVLVISHSSDVQARMERVWTLARDPSTLDSTVHED